MRRLTRRFRERLPLRLARGLVVGAGLVTLAPTAALADRWMPPHEDAVPRFYIEEIAVEGARKASTDIIVSETLLDPGLPYSETELREAVFRVNRLPFVLEADFALRKGSERGRYRLLITVREARNLFFGTDWTYNNFGGPLVNSSPLGDEFSASLTAGVRYFASDGVFFAALGGNENLQIGYTRYKLFNRPMLLRVAYAHEECCPVELLEPGLDPAIATWTATGAAERLEVSLGVPLGGNHSLRFDASRVETRSMDRRLLRRDNDLITGLEDVEQEEIEVAWVYDTTDDPVFPDSGDAVTASVSLRQLEGDLSTILRLGPVATFLATPSAQVSSRLVGLDAHGTRHWPLSPRQTVSLSLEVLLSRSDVDNLPVELEDGTIRLVSDTVDAVEAEIGLRHSVRLRGPRPGKRSGEVRWETLANLVYLETSSAFNALDQPLWGLSASTGIALRNSWGIFRFGIAYLDFDGDL
ncbi:MAG: hypothetical protein AAF657_20645 [Acidobacteriota bacterium]